MPTSLSNVADDYPVYSHFPIPRQEGLVRGQLVEAILVQRVVVNTCPLTHSRSAPAHLLVLLDEVQGCQVLEQALLVLSLDWEAMVLRNFSFLQMVLGHSPIQPVSGAARLDGGPCNTEGLLSPPLPTNIPSKGLSVCD